MGELVTISSQLPAPLSAPMLITDFRPFRDARGTFQKVFRKDVLEKLGCADSFRESFISFSEPGVIRGMHFQTPPSDHWKLVSCIAGEILDVCVDLRKGPTYGKVSSFSLAVENGFQLLIPPGFAHGFLSKGSIPSGVLYLVSTEHDPKHDFGIRWNSIGFNWGVEKPIISERDKGFPPLSEFASPFQ